MSTSSPVVALAAIKRSPATLQYRIKSTRPTKFYKPRFILDPADRAKTINLDRFRKTDPMMPPYPYGPDIRYPEANEGLYGGSSILSGNKISKGRNKGKTLRKWYPNVGLERIRSEALGEELTIPIASRVMRTIKKVGGLDEYLTGTKPARVKELGLLGWKLRWMVLNSPKWSKKYQDARAAMGLPAKAEDPLNETFTQVWRDEARRLELVQKQGEKWDELREKDERFKKHFTKNIISDRTNLRIPDLSTLSFYSPESLQVQSIQVVEEKETSTSPNHPSSDVSR